MLGSGIPPNSGTDSATYLNDLKLRLHANQVLGQILQDQAQFVLISIPQNSMRSLSHLRLSWSKSESILELHLFPLHSHRGIALTIADTGLNDSNDYNQHKADVNAYLNAESFVFQCTDYSGSIYANTGIGFDNVYHGSTPNIIQGHIQNASATVSYNSTWVPYTGSSPCTPPCGMYMETPISGNMTVTLLNTGTQTASYQVFARFHFTDSIYRAITDVPTVANVLTKVAGGQIATIQVPFFDQKRGVYPVENSSVVFEVLGIDGNGTTYFVDSTTTTCQWHSVPVYTANKLTRSYDVTSTASATNSIVGDPIRCYVIPDAKAQTYQVHIWVSNPFGETSGLR